MPAPEIISTLSKQETIKIPYDEKLFCVRLLTFIPGKLFSSIKNQKREMLISLGETMARLDKSLEGYTHKMMNRVHLWNLSHSYLIRNHFSSLSSFPQNKKETIEQIITDYEKYTLPHLAQAKSGVIHGDVNDNNIIVDPSETSIASLIDFGDIGYGPYINELAIGITYGMLDQKNFLQVGRYILNGYQNVFPLEKKDLKLLPQLIKTRLATSLTMAANSVIEKPDNQYSQITAKPAWELLEQLIQMTEEKILEELMKSI